MKKELTAILFAALIFTSCAAVEESIPESTESIPEDIVVVEETFSETEAPVTSVTTQSETSAEPDETEAEEPDTAEAPAEDMIHEDEPEAIVRADDMPAETTSAETAASEEEPQTSDPDDENSITEITLTYYKVTLGAGESSMPYVTMYPEDAPDKSEIWTSSDESVATVDHLGNITGVSAGSCTVTVQSAVCPDVCAAVDVTITGGEKKSAKKVSDVTYINGILVVNKTYALPEDYNPGVDPDAKAAFEEMQKDAAAAGLNIYISSGFRSYEYQSGLYDRYVSRSGQAEADRYSARPGHSEHQTGLAFDLNTIDITFADTDEYVWVRKHCAEYGFIIRYPENGESITGYMYEPWHIRYLGRANAQKVTESGLTLEEYLGITSEYSD